MLAVKLAPLASDILQAFLQQRNLFLLHLDVVFVLARLLHLDFQLSRDIAALLFDLLAALHEVLLLLREPLHFQMQAVMALLIIGALTACAGKLGLKYFQCRFCRCKICLPCLYVQAALLHLVTKHFDLALPCQHAVQLGLGRVIIHAGAGKNMPFAANQAFTGLQVLTHGPGLAAVCNGVNTMQPFVQQRCRPLHPLPQGYEFRIARIQGFLPRLIQRERGRRRIGQPGFCIGHIWQGNRLEAFAQHAFQRVFPARLDPDFLPQARQRIQLVLLQPGLELVVVFEAVLHLLQGMQSGFNPGGVLLGRMGGVLGRRAGLAPAQAIPRAMVSCCNCACSSWADSSASSS